MKLNLTVISVTNKTAPLEIRRRLSFTKRRRAEFMREICGIAAKEVVMISTCNRTELYAVSEADIEDKLIGYISSEADIGKEYLRIYKNRSAVEHLFRITPGLESMVIGEDQILGQVKDALVFAQEHGFSGAYLNTLFRLAVTAAKRVKTDTKLSEIPVSVATIAVKACIRELGTLDDKRILMIGATGQMGGIVLKDILAVSKPEIYATIRTRACETDIAEQCRLIDYEERYDHIDAADCIISATASPHYTLTSDKLNRSVKTQKKRVFIDLAVPSDIEYCDGMVYYGIDDLEQLAAENNRRKEAEAKKAEAILPEYINEFEAWRLFYESREKILPLSDKEKKYLYKIKSEKNPIKLANALERIEEGSYEGTAWLA